MPEWKEEILRRLAPLILAPTREAEIVDELSQHLEDRYQEFLTSGQSEDAAFRSALDELKGDDLLARGLKPVESELHRDPIAVGSPAGNHFLSGILQDIRYSFRVLRKSPGFTAVVVLTLALGIGASTAMFSVLYGLVLRPLPYANPSRMVMLWDSNRQTGQKHAFVIEGSFPILRSQAKSFEDMAAFNFVSSGGLFSPKLWGSEERVATAWVSPQLFSILGAAPLLGRTFTASEGIAIKKGSDWVSPDVAILSYAFWRRHYGASPDVIGKAITLNEFGEKRQFTIVGVMPKDFDFPYPLDPDKPDIWSNSLVATGAFGPAHDLQVLGRLKPGVSMAQAQAEINTIADRIRAQYPKVYKDEYVSVVPLSSELIQNVRSVLWVLLAAFTFILLIGCANVGNLLLVRAVSREKEMTIRATLGAGRLALIRQMLTEAMLLALAGGALGLFLAYAGLRAFVALLPQSIYVPRLDSVALDTRMLVFAAALSMIVAGVFSVLPSLRLTRPNLNETLKSGNARAERSGHSVLHRPGSALLVVEVSLTLVLLTGALLMLRSMQKLLAVNSQFQPERLLSLYVDADNAYYNSLPSRDPIWTLFEQFEQRVAAMPGVESVALTDRFPLVTLRQNPNQFKADGGGGSVAEAFQPAEMHIVTPSYFDMMGMRLLRGRWLADSDEKGSLPVAVINEAMAERYWRDRDPLGVRLRPSRGLPEKGASFTIVGIIREPKRFASGETPEPAVYVAYSQDPWPLASILVRTTSDTKGLAAAIRAAALQMDPSHMFVGPVQTGEDLISESSAMPRFATQLLTAFSSLALLLAVVGIYGLISYYTSRRTHEIGVRMALGAQRRDVMELVLKEGMLIAGLGVAIGVVAAGAFARTLESLLYGVAATDLASFAASVSVLVIVALAACYFPARRAMRVDPMIALRYE